MQITVEEGDITRFVGSALVVPIISGSDWDDTLHQALRRAAGNYYHIQIGVQWQERYSGFSNIVYIPGQPHSELPFGDVMFVFDRLKVPLRAIVAEVLEQANRRKVQTLLVPPLRTGEWGGLYSEPTGSAAFELILALREFNHCIRLNSLRRVTCVVNDNPGVAHQLKQLLALSAS